MSTHCINKGPEVQSSEGSAVNGEDPTPDLENSCVCVCVCVCVCKRQNGQEEFAGRESGGGVCVQNLGLKVALVPQFLPQRQAANRLQQ